MDIRIVDNLESIPVSDWNALTGADAPFLRHEFLVALERHGCVGDNYGWLPRHITVYEGDRLIGAAPMYLKDNSYGELVFDWDWAHAYQRAGLDYYPKLVSAIPYTPATGPRLLYAADMSANRVTDALIAGATELARQLNVSSLHWLFPTDTQTEALERHGLMRRLGCQFHWENRGYRDFDDYLETFTAKKRKKIRRERRAVQEADVEIEILHGDEMNAEQWRILHGFYRSTFARKSGIPTLSLGFFEEISRTMGRNLVLMMARNADRYVAGAINLRGADTLYGRHWGCAAHFDNLHFEACYYQGLDYCLREGLQRFEPGAQGEHKISRGFLPTPTWSAHWIAHEGFREAIGDFLQRETRAMQDYIDTLTEHSPFKEATANHGDREEKANDIKSEQSE